MKTRDMKPPPEGYLVDPLGRSTLCCYGFWAMSYEEVGQERRGGSV